MSTTPTRGTTTLEWLVLAGVVFLLALLVGVKVHRKLNPEKAALPDWVPSYPGVQPTKYRSSSNQTTIFEEVTFQTTDSPEKVMRFFSAALNAGGLMVALSPGETQILNSRQCDSTRHVSVSAWVGDAGKTEVHVTYTETRPEWAPRPEPTREAKLPNWVPAYPGASMIADPSRSRDDYQYWGAFFKTFDPAEEVFEYYARALAMPGFTVEVSWSYPSDRKFGGRITAQETGGRRKVIVDMSPSALKECPSKVEVSWFGREADTSTKETATDTKEGGGDAAVPAK